MLESPCDAATVSDWEAKDNGATLGVASVRGEAPGDSAAAENCEVGSGACVQDEVDFAVPAVCATARDRGWETGPPCSALPSAHGTTKPCRG